jgi:peptide/nickel transport system substrate-binding protein
VLAVVVLALAGCGGSSSSGTEAANTEQGADAGKIPPGEAPQTVSIALRDDVDTFNPAQAVNTMADLAIYDAVYGSLVSLATGGPEAGGVLPNLAESWKVNSAKSVTFQVHKGLSCEDGTPLPPSAIAESIEWLGDPETAATFHNRMFGSGEVSVEADDKAGSLTVNVTKPYSSLLEGLSVAYVVCPNALDDPDKLSQKPAGTGAYEVGSLKRGQEYVLQRRDDFKALPPEMTIDQFPKTLTMRVVTDESTTANLLQTGEVDIGSVLGQEAGRLRAVPNLSEITGSGFGAGVMIFNQSEGLIGADPEVRRAFAHAVDGAAWAKAATFEVSPPSNTIYTPNMPCYDEANGELTPAFDLDEARTILEQDGWSAGADGTLSKGGKPLKVRLLGHNLQNSGPEYIASNLEELGAQVEVTNGTFTNAVNVLFGSGDWDVFVFPFSGEIYVPSNVGADVSGTLEEGSVNVGHIENAEYEADFDKAVGIVGEQACPTWSDAEAAILKAVDGKPLMWETAAWFGKDITFQAQFWKLALRTIRTAG